MRTVFVCVCVCVCVYFCECVYYSPHFNNKHIHQHQRSFHNTNAKRITHTKHVYDCHWDNSIYKHCTTKQRAAYRGTLRYYKTSSYRRLHCIVLCLIKRFYWHLVQLNSMREVRPSLRRILWLRPSGILRRVARCATTNNSYPAAASIFRVQECNFQVHGSVHRYDNLNENAN